MCIVCIKEMIKLCYGEAGNSTLSVSVMSICCVTYLLQ